MGFYCGYVAPAHAVYLKKLFIGCLKNFLWRLEMINQTLAKQISDPRYTF